MKLGQRPLKGRNPNPLSEEPPAGPVASPRRSRIPLSNSSPNPVASPQPSRIPLSNASLNPVASPRRSRIPLSNASLNPAAKGFRAASILVAVRT